jgi:hypothetical protein
VIEPIQHIKRNEIKARTTTRATAIELTTTISLEYRPSFISNMILAKERIPEHYSRGAPIRAVASLYFRIFRA